MADMSDWVRLRLDVDTFDFGAFERYVHQARDAGIELSSMTAVGGTTPDNQRALYELNKICSADIPDRGEFYTFEQYVAQRIDVPVFSPDGVVVARDAEGGWIGFSATSLRPEGHALNEMTGVLRAYRGRGLSLALKVVGIRFVKAAGYRWIDTMHHPRNDSAIAMNRRLGFVDRL